MTSKAANSHRMYLTRFRHEPKQLGKFAGNIEVCTARVLDQDWAGLKWGRDPHRTWTITNRRTTKRGTLTIQQSVFIWSSTLSNCEISELMNILPKWNIIRMHVDKLHVGQTKFANIQWKCARLATHVLNCGKPVLKSMSSNHCWQQRDLGMDAARSTRGIACSRP